MRPLVSPSVALAAAVLTGSAVVAGASLRSAPEREARRASGDSPAAAVSPFSPSSLSTGTSFPASPASLAFGAAQVRCRNGRTRDFMNAPKTLPPELPEFREFYFTRAVYSGRGWGWGWGRRRNAWATDFPKADHQFIAVFKELIDLDAYDCENAVRLDDPALRRFPFLYALEVGAMALRQEEIEGLRSYLEAGGFLVIDDFWGTREWRNFVDQIHRVLPGKEMIELPMDHPIFHTIYDIEEVLQVPNIGNGRRGGPYWENGGRIPRVYGIHDDDGRLMVVVNYNTDLGDAWEWAEDPFYPLDRSKFAMEMGANMIAYSMTH